jgi:hypothetical protein
MTTPSPTNPLLDALNSALRDGVDLETTRNEAVRRFGFAVPTPAAMAALRKAAPAGVLEIGAGTGYWAWYAHQHGIDVTATDPHPAPSPKNRWFAHTSAWHPIGTNDHNIVSAHPNRTLLIVWPTKNETWPVQALDLYAQAGGTCIIYVGEPPHGKTGDDAFHARLGEIKWCLQCDYGMPDSPCVCGYPAQWTRTAQIELPSWPDCQDDMVIYQRKRPTWRRPPRHLRRA